MSKTSFHHSYTHWSSNINYLPPDSDILTEASCAPAVASPAPHRCRARCRLFWQKPLKSKPCAAPAPLLLLLLWLFCFYFLSLSSLHTRSYDCRSVRSSWVLGTKQTQTTWPAGAWELHHTSTFKCLHPSVSLRSRDDKGWHLWATAQSSATSQG